MRFSHLIPRALLVVVAAAIVWQAPQAFLDVARDIESERGRTVEERAIAPVRAFDLPAEPFVDAARVIPERATYHLVVGDGMPLTDFQRLALEPLLRYWLLPRRLTPAGEAEWVIAYGAPLPGGTELTPGVAVARVKR